MYRPGIMYNAVDSTEYGRPSVMDNRQTYGVFFVVVIVIGSLFMKNMFTATILEGYSKYYAEITGMGAGMLLNSSAHFSTQLF